MDLFRAMRTFISVVEAGSMSAAAPRLGLTSAMVGQHIAALEDRLGTRLINRTTRRQSLTEFGASYLDQCRDILERVALSDQEAETVRRVPSGLLRITAPVTFGSEVLMASLEPYRTAAPDVILDIVLTDRNVDLIEEGFDVAFRIATPPDGRLIARRLTAYRMALCAAPGYLARAGIPSHPSDLAHHEAVLFTPAARAPWRLTRAGEVVEVTPRAAVRVNSGQALRVAAQAGLGIILQPLMLIGPDLAAGRLAQVLPDWNPGERTVSLLYYRDRRMTPRLSSFISFAMTAFADRG
ncbi:LysR family transcriptional regulator [Segnochrobactrum spirostomi]|uniref:LysR family transcriptional regulator n=1 Tax=Segnochrobactrum spirostomi TaxID=2608987 RepID=A0A6A7YA16_9HYPH|nr:LysR family transcriptional regulator [Segnochrobactrum spirostomi]MQT14858.1 LysR family transcriptional regulator [Segnochrobactrum spirostomi]